MKTEETRALHAANVELVRRFLEVLETEGLAGVRAQAGDFWHQDLEWRPAMLSFGRETYRGLDEYSAYLAEAEATSGEDSGRLDVEEIVARGDRRVLALGQVVYDNRDGHGPAGYEYGLLMEVDDGLSRSGRSFLSHAAAQKAAEGDA